MSGFLYFVEMPPTYDSERERGVRSETDKMWAVGYNVVGDMGYWVNYLTLVLSCSLEASSLDLLLSNSLFNHFICRDSVMS